MAQGESLASGSSATSRFRFAGFVFDERSGEISSAAGDQRVITRLSPQPARLLAQLIRQRPDVVTRDEIKALLWPDVEVDFEQSLHTCIRQIRSALGDSATAPRFIETIPRRGYRFLQELGEDSAMAHWRTADSLLPSARHASRRLLTGAAVAVPMLAALALALFWAGSRPDRAIRVAVMPFEPAGTESVLLPGNDLAESIVEALVRGGFPATEVIGPTTTEAYENRPRAITTLTADFRVDFVVNARDSIGSTGPRVLVEVIRTTDGAHVWVSYLDELLDGESPSEQIARAVRKATLQR